MEELSQLTEKLRLQLTEKEGTIATLTRANLPRHQMPVSFAVSDILLK